MGTSQKLHTLLEAASARRTSAGILAAMTVALAMVMVVPASASRSSAPGPAACSGRNGQIAIVRNQPGGEELGLLAGGRFTRLYRVPRELGRDHAFDPLLDDPSFSCDGERIVVIRTKGYSNRTLVVVDVADRRAHTVPTDHHLPFEPSFLADGSIVFAGPRIHHRSHTSFGKSRLGGTFVVDPDGSRLHRLFGRQQLAASRDGRFFIAADPEGGGLLLLDAKGRALRTLTLAARGRAWAEPSFSLDGRRIVFEGHTENRSVLFLTRRDRPGLRRLTPLAGLASEASFSPDGRRLLYTRGSRGGQPWVRALGPAERKNASRCALTSSSRSGARGESPDAGYGIDAVRQRNSLSSMRAL